MKEDIRYTISKPKPPDDNYTIVPNELLKADISYYDFKLLVYLLSHKDGFKLNKTFIAKGMDSNTKSVRASFKRLTALGVLTIDNMVLSINFKALPFLAPKVLVDGNQSTSTSIPSTQSTSTQIPSDEGIKVLVDGNQSTTSLGISFPIGGNQSTTNKINKQDEKQDYENKTRIFSENGMFSKETSVLNDLDLVISLDSHFKWLYENKDDWKALDISNLRNSYIAYMIVKVECDKVKDSYVFPNDFNSKIWGLCTNLIKYSSKHNTQLYKDFTHECEVQSKPDLLKRLTLKDKD